MKDTINMVHSAINQAIAGMIPKGIERTISGQQSGYRLMITLRMNELGDLDVKFEEWDKVDATIN